MHYCNAETPTATATYRPVESCRLVCHVGVTEMLSIAFVTFLHELNYEM